MKQPPPKTFSQDKWTNLEDEFKSAMKNNQSEAQGDSDSNTHIDESLTRMNSCLQQAINKCVPNKKRLGTIKREPSERTRALYEARAQKFSTITAQGGTVTKQLRKRWNKKICSVNLKDYNSCLEQMVTKMEDVDKRGDSETVFRVVKVVSGLMTAASAKAPSTDKNGDLILDQEKLSKV